MVVTKFFGYSCDHGIMDDGKKWSGFRVFLQDENQYGSKSYISKMPDNESNYMMLDEIAIGSTVSVSYDRSGRITSINPIPQS